MQGRLSGLASPPAIFPWWSVNLSDAVLEEVSGPSYSVTVWGGGGISKADLRGRERGHSGRILGK